MRDPESQLLPPQADGGRAAADSLSKRIGWDKASRTDEGYEAIILQVEKDITLLEALDAALRQLDFNLWDEQGQRKATPYTRTLPTR